MLGEIDGQPISLVQVEHRFFEAVRMALQHVIATHAKLRQLVARESKSRHQRTKVLEAHPSIVVQSEKRRAAQTITSQKLSDDERVELPMRQFRHYCVPQPSGIVRLKPRPILRKANLDWPQRASRLAD